MNTVRTMQKHRVDKASAPSTCDVGDNCDLFLAPGCVLMSLWASQSQDDCWANLTAGGGANKVFLGGKWSSQFKPTMAKIHY
ncbi:hypothetical protein J6590_066430 [Homalodisca vitripennis]|nr:hypothetical protein J6590_066430 [Homalodisca vitripennis]